jgi:tRNA U34 5-carboxymethylaminomethyl modifying GTPase MnmE/TrmE
MDGQSFTSIVLGETGVGKSAFINAINQKRELKISDGPYNCTKYIQTVDREYNGQTFLFIDTPGFSFPNEDEEENAFIEIERAFQTYKDRIRCILILKNFNDRRIRRNELEFIQRIMDCFPVPNSWKHVLIIYTHSYKGEYRFEHEKKNMEKFVNALHSEDLQKFMMKRNIDIPLTVDEFFVDCDNDDLKETFENNKDEFEKIFFAIKSRKPMF